MSLRISGKNLEIGESLHGHARERVNGAIARFFDGQATGHVTIQPEGSGFRADLVLHVASGITLQAEGRAHDPYASLNQAVERIENRLRRHKRRLRDRNTVPVVASAQVPVDLAASYVIEAPEDEELAADFSPVVVAESKTALKRMAVSAAVLELDMSGAQVVVFRHSTSGEVNVVYRRADGHIGWVDPSGGSEQPGKRPPR